MLASITFHLSILSVSKRTLDFLVSILQSLFSSCPEVGLSASMHCACVEMKNFFFLTPFFFFFFPAGHALRCSTRVTLKSPISTPALTLLSLTYYFQFLPIEGLKKVTVNYGQGLSVTTTASQPAPTPASCLWGHQPVPNFLITTASFVSHCHSFSQYPSYKLGRIARRLFPDLHRPATFDLSVSLEVCHELRQVFDLATLP